MTALSSLLHLPGSMRQKDADMEQSGLLCANRLGAILQELGFCPDLEAPVVLCIGTDRIIGDSLGPLTGSLLLQHPEKHLEVYGSLRDTVHARNLPEVLAHIKRKHPYSTVIAVDASLGLSHKIGSVFVRPGSLKPGMGVYKDLPAAGDVSIAGISGQQSGQPYLSLQAARLSVVMEMAEQISRCILDVCG